MVFVLVTNSPVYFSDQAYLVSVFVLQYLSDFGLCDYHWQLLEKETQGKHEKENLTLTKMVLLENHWNLHPDLLSFCRLLPQGFWLTPHTPSVQAEPAVITPTDCLEPSAFSSPL